MTRSFANCVAEGALIESPGGGPFRLEVMGVLVDMPKSVFSCGLAGSGVSLELPGFCPFCLASMICLCWSRTSKLLCSCSRIAGSCVWKPGERHAKPTSCIAKPAESRDVKGAEGRAVCGPRGLATLLDRSSRFGRGRAECIEGEAGSFLTLIMGVGPRTCSPEPGEPLLLVRFAADSTLGGADAATFVANGRGEGR